MGYTCSLPEMEAHARTFDVTPMLAKLNSQLQLFNLELSYKGWKSFALWRCGGQVYGPWIPTWILFARAAKTLLVTAKLCKYGSQQKQVNEQARMILIDCKHECNRKKYDVCFYRQDTRVDALSEGNVARVLEASPLCVSFSTQERGCVTFCEGKCLHLQGVSL